MDPFFGLVEQKLAEAERQGAFRNLAGKGAPLQLEDLSDVPAELRTGYILLKSNGYLPPELEAKKAWLQLSDLLAACTDKDERGRLQRDVLRAREHYRALRDRRALSERYGRV